MRVIGRAMPTLMIEPLLLGALDAMDIYPRCAVCAKRAPAGDLNARPQPH